MSFFPDGKPIRDQVGAFVSPAAVSRWASAPRAWRALLITAILAASAGAVEGWLFGFEAGRPAEAKTFKGKIVYPVASEYGTTHVVHPPPDSTRANECVFFSAQQKIRAHVDNDGNINLTEAAKQTRGHVLLTERIGGYMTQQVDLGKPAGDAAPKECVCSSLDPGGAVSCWTNSKGFLIIAARVDPYAPTTTLAASYICL